jgi:hypothetical protein
MLCTGLGGAEVSKEDLELRKELCKEKEAGEWFRLSTGEGDNCRDVIQCTNSGLQAIRSVGHHENY